MTQKLEQTGVIDGAPVLVALSDEDFRGGRFSHIRTEPDGAPVYRRWSAAENAARDAAEAEHAARKAAGRKPAAKAEIDRQAEAARQVFITTGAGQSMVYERKAQEAERLAVDADPDPADYPLLSASVGIEAESLEAVATIVLGTRDAWLSAAAAIEAQRLGAKAAIDALNDPADPAEIQTVLDGLVWPFPGD